MHAYQLPGETKKATVEQDDVDGWCGIYPESADPKQCEPALGGGEGGEEGCCAVAGRRSTSFGRGVMPGGLLALLGLLLVRRR
jgi:hypothetical protein